MDKNTYDKISDFCNGYKETFLTDIEKSYILKKFLEGYFEALEDYKKKHEGKLPSTDEEQAMVDALLNTTSLTNSAISATSFYNQVKVTLENDFKKNNARTDFWKNVGASILANLIYAILLGILFWVAKDQIATWLSQVGNIPN